MAQRNLHADLMLIACAAIWGFAFVAQRIGMDHMGPFYFNAARFFLGCLSLVPLVWWFTLRPKARERSKSKPNANANGKTKGLIVASLACGVVLFIASSFQQVGLVYTSATNAGFITGLYVILVPVLGIFLRQRTGFNTWLGGSLGCIGLYLLSGAQSDEISPGDLLQLMGALFWAVHVLVIGHMAQRYDALQLSLGQMLVCCLLSAAGAGAFETIDIQPLFDAAIPIAYAGILSVGVAYTLQVVAQEQAAPAHVAIILSLEAVFAAIGGWLILDEQLSSIGFFGCGLMLFGMLLSQLNLKRIFRLKTLDNREQG